MKQLLGRVALVIREDDFDVDQIVGVANIKIYDAERLAQLAVAWCGAGFAGRVRPGDFIVGGRNFGYGHPHPQAMMAMRHLGIASVLAESFAPAYQASEIYRGLPQLACPGILTAARQGDRLAIDWQAGLVANQETGALHPFEPLSASELAILEAGDVFAWLRRGQTTPQDRRR